MNYSNKQNNIQENFIFTQKFNKEFFFEKIKEDNLEFNENKNYNEINPEIISEFTTYLSQKKKKFDTLKLFKTPRVEVVKILLNETKSDKNLFNKTLSNNFLE